MAYFGRNNAEELSVHKAKVAGGFSTYRTEVRFVHIIYKELEAVVGNFAFHNWYAAHNRSEIGYTMKGEQYRNKGYMKEALPYIIRYGFREMQLNQLEAFIHPDNRASRRLVEGVGFVHEGLLKKHHNDHGVLSDSMLCRLLRNEYKG